MSDEDDLYCSECGEELEEGVEELCISCRACTFGDVGPDDVDESFSNYLIDGVGFADPNGNSALRAATPNNPRNQPCPTCGTPNVLTLIDVQRGYQCDTCADAAERGW